MSGNLGATLEDVAWVVTAYAIANVIIIPMTSFLAARFGRRHYYIGSILLFTAASMACGQAHNIWELVDLPLHPGDRRGRPPVDLAGDPLRDLPARAARLRRRPVRRSGSSSGPPSARRSAAGSSTTTPGRGSSTSTCRSGSAPPSWPRSTSGSPNTPAPPAHIDWTGIVLLVAGLGSLQTVLERGETEDWFSKPYIVVLAVVAAVSLVAFVAWELTTKHPVVDLRVLRSRTLATAATLTFVLGFALFATVFIVPVFAQRLLDFTAHADRHALPAGSGGVGRRPAVRGPGARQGPAAAVPGRRRVRRRSRCSPSSSRASTCPPERTISSGRSCCGPSGLSFMFVPLAQLAVSGPAAPRHPAGRGPEQHDAAGRRLVRHRRHQHLPRPPDRRATAWTWSPGWCPAIRRPTCACGS